MSIPMYNSVVKGTPWSYTKCSLTPSFFPRRPGFSLVPGSQHRMLTAL